MATIERFTLTDMFRDDPVKSTLLIIVPLLLALLQLANSVVNELSFLISVPFALVVAGYVYLLTQYSFAQFQRRQIERAFS